MKQWGVAFLLCALALSAAGALAEGQQPTVQFISPQAGLSLSTDSVSVQVRVAAAPPAKIASVELSVDGLLHSTRILTPPSPAGNCTLQWDTPHFANGEHLLAVTAKDTAGKQASVELRVILDRPIPGSRDLPTVAIQQPRAGQEVSGVTNVTVSAEHPSGIKYVMIFVDDLFAFMANRPPFSYAWDTRRVVDGLHTLVARAQAGNDAEADSDAVQVTVNNSPKVEPEPKPGGIREITMADVRRPESSAKAPQPAATATVAVPSASPQPAESVAPAASASPGEAGTMARPEALAPAVSTPSAPSAQPAPAAVRGTVAGSSPEPASAGPVRGAVRMAAAPSGLSTPKAGPAPAPAKAAVEPAPVEARQAPGVEVAQAPLGALSAIGGVIRALPVATAAEPVRAVGFAPAVGRMPKVQPEAPRVAVPKPAPAVKPPVRAREIPAPQPSEAPAPSLMQPRPQPQKPAEGLRLYYNGAPLETDVQPVIRAGIAAGPFRHIIEHTGGRVSWQPDTRTVTADALAKHISLTIGSRDAIVNDRVLTMDLAAYLEQGRAMVPLRFFRDALDFTVEYDPATGRICIQR